MKQNYLPPSKITPQQLFALSLQFADTQEKATRIISQARIDINECDLFGRTPLQYAIREGHVNAIRWLVMNDAYTIFNWIEGTPTALHSAVLYNHIEAVKCLLSLSPSLIDEEDDDYRTPIHLAIERGNIKALKELIPSDRIDVLDKRGRAPLHIAVDFHNIEAVKHLIGRGANINAFNKQGTTALHRAVYYGNVDIITFLLSQGANIDAFDKYGWKPIVVAIRERHEGATKSLIDYGASVNEVMENGVAVWYEALEPKQYNFFEHHFFIHLRQDKDSKLNIEQTDERGRTALHHAAYKGKIEIIGTLVKQGANIHAVDMDGWTPIAYAVEGMQYGAINILSRAGADINKISKNGFAAWYKALVSKHYSFFDILRESVIFSIDIYQPDEIGRIVLHHAAARGHVEVIRELIGRYKVDPSVRDLNERTALHYAVWHNHFDAVRSLLEFGIDTNVRDCNGATALDLALQKERWEIMEILLNKEAQSGNAEMSAGLVATGGNEGQELQSNSHAAIITEENINAVFDKLMQPFIEETIDEVIRDLFWYNTEHMSWLSQMFLGYQGVITIAPTLIQATEALNNNISSSILSLLTSRSDLGSRAVLPLNLRGNHWVGLVLRYENGHLHTIYNDPLGDALSPENRAHLTTYIQDTINQSGIDVGFDGIRDLRLAQQNNAIDCGPITVNNLIRLALANIDYTSRDSIIQSAGLRDRSNQDLTIRARYNEVLGLRDENGEVSPENLELFLRLLNEELFDIILTPEPASESNLEVVETPLIVNEPQVNSNTEMALEASHPSAIERNRDITQLLLERESSINQTNTEEVAPLQLAEELEFKASIGEVKQGEDTAKKPKKPKFLEGFDLKDEKKDDDDQDDDKFSSDISLSPIYQNQEASDMKDQAILELYNYNGFSIESYPSQENSSTLLGIEMEYELGAKSSGIHAWVGNYKIPDLLENPLALLY